MLNQRRTFLTSAFLFLVGGGVVLLGWFVLTRDSIPVLHSNPSWWTPGQNRTPYVLRGQQRPRYGYEESYFPTNDYAQVRVLRDFAAAAQLYNFDPTITYYRSNTTSDRVTLETPTHSGLFIRGKLRRVESFYDSSDTDGKPQVVKKWHQCTGKWSEEAAIKEAFDCLRRLGKTNTIAEVLAGRLEYEAEEVVVRKPDGKKVKVAPFPVVRMFDKDRVLRVRVEFRMGTNCPVGVTCWYCATGGLAQPTTRPGGFDEMVQSGTINDY